MQAKDLSTYKKAKIMGGAIYSHYKKKLKRGLASALRQESISTPMKQSLKNIDAQKRRYKMYEDANK